MVLATIAMEDERARQLLPLVTIITFVVRSDTLKRGTRRRERKVGK